MQEFSLSGDIQKRHQDHLAAFLQDGRGDSRDLSEGKLMLELVLKLSVCLLMVS